MKLRESGDFMKAWGGIASLQLRLPVVWTEARRRGFSLLDVTQVALRESGRTSFVAVAKRAQSLLGTMPTSSSGIRIEEFIVDAHALHHRHKITPYDGETLSGVVQKTFLRGRKVYDSGHFDQTPRGQMLLK